MSRYVVTRCSLWCKTGAISRLVSLTFAPLRQDRCYYRHSRHDTKTVTKLHRRVVDEKVTQQQLDIMKLSLADLESADKFGSLSIDCDVDEDLKYLAESEEQVATPASKRRKTASSAVSSKTDDHSQMRSSFTDKEVVADTHQEGKSKGPSHSRQLVGLSGHANKQRISVPVEVSNEHSELYNKHSGKKSFPDIHPSHKDWSEKFGSLSHDVDKFLDKYAISSKRYSCIFEM